MKVAVLGANWSLCAEAIFQTVVPANGLPSPSVQLKAAPPHSWTSMPRCRLYQACSAGASLALKKMPPTPVTRFIEPPIGFIGPSGFQVVGDGHRAGAGLVLASAGQFGDLADVAEVVEHPFIQHLRHGDLAVLLVKGEAIARAGGEVAEELDVVLALLFEVIEGILGVGIPIEVEIHLRVVGLEFGTGLRQETVKAHAVTVP